MPQWSPQEALYRKPQASAGLAMYMLIPPRRPAPSPGQGRPGESLLAEHFTHCPPPGSSEPTFPISSCAPPGNSPSLTTGLVLSLRNAVKNSIIRSDPMPNFPRWPTTYLLRPPGHLQGTAHRMSIQLGCPPSALPPRSLRQRKIHVPIVGTSGGAWRTRPLSSAKGEMFSFWRKAIRWSTIVSRGT